MKKAGKLFVLLIFLVIFSLCAVTAFASDAKIAVASTDFYIHEGETFTTTVYIPDNANIVDFDVTVRYDSDLVTLVSAEENEDIKGSITFNSEIPGVIGINYTRASKNVTTYTPLLDLTFKTNDEIGVGVYDCLAVDKNETYIAHTLNSSGSLEKVDFECDFAKLIIYEIGDVDLSTEVDIGDATYIRRHLAQIEGSVLTGFKLSLADTYTDDIVDIADAICLQRHLAKYDSPFYGNRVNITFCNADGSVYVKKSVAYNGTLNGIPQIPANESYKSGKWSASPDEYIEPVYSELTKDLKLYPIYSDFIDPAMDYYKSYLTDMYYSGDLPTNMCADQNLISTVDYQGGYHAALVWSSDCNYVLNQTTGEFTKPTFPQDVALTAKIISYNEKNEIIANDNVVFDYDVPGIYNCPTKSEVAGFLDHYLKDSTDGKSRINYDVKLISSVSNTVLPTEGSLYDNCEVRLEWYQNVNGSLVPVSRVKRTTSPQVNDYVVLATFNGKPLQNPGEADGDGKIYFDDVEVTPIDELEIRNYIINQIAANQGTLATNNTELWDNDTVYGTNVTWETGNSKIGYVANNVIELKDDAVSGSILPLNARVSYSIGDTTNEFILSYNLTVSCNNTKIVSGTNMDPELYKAIKSELEDNLGYRGDLTSAALADVRFVNLDLSGYPDISSLRGLSYCTNLRTLNISGLHITDGTMNQIATLSYLEAFVARNCGLNNLTDGGTATLKNAVNLKLLDLTNNNFTSLNSVFAEGVKYGKLREVYLSSNKLTDINALSRAPMMTYLSLSDNGLTTEGIASVANYPALSYLSLANNNIDSIDSLIGLKYLKELRLQNNNLSDVRELRKLINLELLYLGHNSIKDIGFFNTLTELKVLYVNDNQITDISTLTDLTKLEAINVSNNKLSSLSVLRYFKSSLTEIYAENNNVTDFSFINGASGLHILMLAGNKVEIAQSNMSTWLGALNEMEVLTLSDIKLNDLSFLDSMDKLVRLDVANCGLTAFAGDDSNIEFIADKYSTLKVLDISNNNMTDSESELLKLRDLSLLSVFYADNVCSSLDISNLTYSMSELRYISLENNGITSASWLSKYDNLKYVDLADNNITEVDLDVYLSKASQKTIDELYLDTNAENCTFINAYRITDFNAEKVSLEGIKVEKVEKLPYMDNVKYLNLAKTGLTNLTGDDPEITDLYSVERYKTVETIDVSGLETSISTLENMDSLKTVYAIGAVDSVLFYKDNLHSLQRLYNKGVDCYLYDAQTKYVPTATKEGKDILNLIDDFSCTITVAADNVISDNNPFIVDSINDYDITWTVSNSNNYEIVNNRLSVKSYTNLDDEILTLTASIKPYDNQAAVTRTFTINTKILRVSSAYYNIEAAGYSTSLARGAVFSYNLTLKSAKTTGFTNAVKPVEDNITYSYSAKTSSGTSVAYANVITPGSNHSFTVTSSAPLGATVTISINITHNNAQGTAVKDISTINVPVTIASRTFTATFVTNGGTLVDSNGAECSYVSRVEDSPIFSGLSLSRTGYEFAGWYKDPSFTTLFSSDGKDAVMPSSDITLYAKWNKISYTITFNANGGSVSATSITAMSDVEIGSLPTPTRTGFTFNGWYTAKTGGTKVTATSKFARTDELPLYAQWTCKSFTASWNTGIGYTISVKRTSSPNKGATIGSLSNRSAIYYGDVLSVTYTASTGYNIAIKGSTSITVSSDVTSSQIFAIAALKNYTVSWSTGTGYTIAVTRTSSPKGGASTGALTSGATVYYGDVLSVTYTAAEGYTLNTTGSTSVTVTDNVTGSTIYATAVLNSYTYNIVCKSSNGTDLGSDTATYKYGTTNTITPPAKTGYITPEPQSVVWDATSKTITFTYTPKSVTTSINVYSGEWMTYMTSNAWIEVGTRTSTSVKVRLKMTNTIDAGKIYGYYQWCNIGKSNGSYTATKGEIANTEFYTSSDTSKKRSSTAYTGWLEIPVSATATSVTVYYKMWSRSASTDDGYFNKTGSKTISIPAY